MKTRNHWRYGVVALVILFFFPVVLHGEGSSQLRIMKKRVEVVMKRKSLFIEKVLNSYGISFKKNQQGVVIKISLGEKWYELERIEIIPQIDGSGRPVSGGGHEIYFITSDRQVLMLLSNIRIH